MNEQSLSHTHPSESHTHLEHEDVPVVHNLLGVVELIVDDLVDDRVAVSLPHPGHDLTRHHHSP